MSCCEPCNNGPAAFTQEVIIPAGDTVTVTVPPAINSRTCRRDVTCLVINRNNNSINAAFTPDSEGVVISCAPLPNPIPESPTGPFLNPGVLTIPTYSTGAVLCNPGTEDVTVLLEWFAGCNCGSLCDPNQDANPVVILEQPIQAEITNDPLTVQIDPTNLTCPDMSLPVTICVNELEFEFACSSVDGRLIIVQIDNQVQPPTITLLELNGDPVVDGSQAVSCNVTLFTSEACFQLIADPTQRYTRILIFDSNNLAAPLGVVWIDNATSTVIPPPLPADIETCLDCCPVFFQQTWCDDGVNPPEPFIRRYTRNSDGTFTNEDLTPEGNIYLIQGNAVVCEDACCPQFFQEILCDNGTDPFTPFIRRYTRLADGTFTNDNLDLNGAIYAVQGIGVVCPAEVEVPKTWALTLCDLGATGFNEVLSTYPGADATPAPWTVNGANFSIDVAGVATSGSIGPIQGVAMSGVGPQVFDLDLNPGPGLTVDQFIVTIESATPIDTIEFDIAPIATTGVNPAPGNPPAFSFVPVAFNDPITFTFAGTETVQVTWTSTDGGSIAILTTVEATLSGANVVFQRCFTSELGVISFEDLDLAGNPYAPTGVPGICPIDVEIAPAAAQNYQGAVYDLQNGATWTPADLPANVELIELSLSVIVGVAANGIINADATVAADLPTGYSVDLRAADPNGILTPHQVIDSGVGGRILVDATWRL